MTIWMLPCSLAALAVSCVAWPDACPGSACRLRSGLHHRIWPLSSVRWRRRIGGWTASVTAAPSRAMRVSLRIHDS